MASSAAALKDFSLDTPNPYRKHYKFWKFFNFFVNFKNYDSMIISSWLLMVLMAFTPAFSSNIREITHVFPVMVSLSIGVFYFIHFLYYLEKNKNHSESLLFSVIHLLSGPVALIVDLVQLMLWNSIGFG